MHLMSIGRPGQIQNLTESQIPRRRNSLWTSPTKWKSAYRFLQSTKGSFLLLLTEFGVQGT